MSESESEMEPTSDPEGQMSAQAAQTLVIGGSFVNGHDVSLNMTGINDMGGDDEVDVYAATGANPTARMTGTGERRGQYIPAPATFPTDLDGGPWTSGENYFVQVDSLDGTTWTTWQGNVTAAAGNLDITLRKKTF